MGQVSNNNMEREKLQEYEKQEKMEEVDVAGENEIKPGDVAGLKAEPDNTAKVDMNAKEAIKQEIVVKVEKGFKGEGKPY